MVVSAKLSCARTLFGHIPFSSGFRGGLTRASDSHAPPSIFSAPERVPPSPQPATGQGRCRVTAAGGSLTWVLTMHTSGVLPLELRGNLGREVERAGTSHSQLGIEPPVLKSLAQAERLRSSEATGRD